MPVSPLLHVTIDEVVRSLRGAIDSTTTALGGKLSAGETEVARMLGVSRPDALAQRMPLLGEAKAELETALAACSRAAAKVRAACHASPMSAAELEREVQAELRRSKAH